jgi:transglutaminase-like putative cysteine protease
MSASSAGAGARVRGRYWQLSLVLLVLFVFASLGLNVVLDGLGWWLKLGLLSAVLLGVALVTRTFSRHRILPPVVAAITLIVTLTVVFAPGTGFLLVVPTTRSWNAFAGLVDQATSSITGQTIPATADPGITFLLVVGVGSLVILADLLAFAFRSPALAGIPALVLVAVPSFTSLDLSDGPVFVLTACAYLWLLQVNRPRGRPRLVLALGIGALAAALVLPVVLPSSGASGPLTAGSGVVGVNPVLALGKDLRSVDDRTVLHYSTLSGASHYLRLVTLDDFRGVSWSPTSTRIDTRRRVDALPSPPGLSKEVARKTEVTTIRIGELSSGWLPLPYPTSSVSGLGGDWYWEPDGLSVSSQDSAVTGQSYTAKSLVTKPTPAQLARAGTAVPQGLTRYLDLPSSLPSIISSTARTVTAGANSNYDRAVALQDFFRLGDFEYSESTPVDDGYDGTGVSVIAKFLEVKSGYCIHFSSAMAVMARALGIPARVAIGFLPGEQNVTGARGQYSVTTHDLHAWPELYFDGIGWVQFEPTPGRGVLPSYANNDGLGQTTPSTAATTAPGPAPSAGVGGLKDPGAADRPGGNSAAGGSTGQGWTAWLWIVGVLLALILIAATPAIVRSSRRTMRLRGLRGGRATASTAWLEILDTAEDVGARPPGTATPSEAAAILLARVGAGTPAAEAIARILVAVEREFYARPGVATSEGAAQADDVVLIDAALLRTVTGVAAVRLRMMPASIWNGLVRTLNRAG